ncbi:ABC transporter permease [Clostridiaceae bacterium UIB06]|uniref:ABC transporter permease n=2 Tax=Clostridium thailandense TaxID=2794346 RepID=A0A949TGX1_9CLOT|nr:ABC transporter permease [Clostridium thailandense]MBV7272010.1 ABC transporter permease [Clostridium thailandense]MCH5137408.1 ABC transporter permease [Clostridiaceae bacterium UIB06]
MNSKALVNNKSWNGSLKALWKKITLFRETTIIFIIVVIGLILTILSPHFLTTDNLMSIAVGLSGDGIVAVGMTIALVSGGFDLSVGSVTSFAGVIVGALYLAGVNIWIACLIAIVIGMLCGLANGIFIGKIGLNPFITTLAIMGIARGGAYVLTQGYSISLFNVPKSFAFIGHGTILGLPFVVVVFILIASIGDFMMRKSEVLRKVLYTGSNEKAAVMSGINILKIKICVYVLLAFLASIAGILVAARFNVATPPTGSGAELSIISISAAVIGGASLNGGEGTILGTVLGLILLNLINNGLIILNIPVYWQDLVNGIILIAAVTIDFLTHRNINKN